MIEQQVEHPEFLMNSRGFKVPFDTIPAQDLLRNDLVLKLTGQAKVLSKSHDEFKRNVFSEANDLVSLLASEYNTEIGGTKGNITLSSFDNKSKIQIGVADQISFGAEIDIAKKLITEVIEEELSESSNFIADLLRDAFEADKQGQFNKNRILTLRKYRNANESDKWKEAMKALDDAIIASNSKTYINFYEKNEFGAWVQVPLVSKSL